MIMALPRGGVPVAAEVAAALNAPLDLILVRKIGVPIQPELAMGAVVDGGAADHRAQRRCNSACGYRARQHSKPFATANWPRSSGGASAIWGVVHRVDIAGRTAIVIDDGIATGATTRAALRASRMRRSQKILPCRPGSANRHARSAAHRC